MARTSGFRTLQLCVPALFAVLTLSACAWFDTDARRGFSERGKWDEDEPRVYTTADIRMIIRRHHPETGQEVTCTEPTPDVAKALSTAAAFTAQGGSKAGASGQIGASGGSAEAVAELAGRSTALIALRDGLYRTCEAYVNGAIGSDAYALVLSRYGQLMTTLFLGEDIRGAAALSNPSPPQSPPLITVTSGPTAQVQGNSTGGTGTTPSGGAAPSGGGDSKGKNTKSSGTVNITPGFLKVANPSGAAPADTNNQNQNKSAAGQADTSNSDSTQGKKQKGANTGDQSSTDTTTAAKPQPASPTTASASPSAVAAVSLVRMNEDYYDLDVNFMHQLVVACINEYDPTRVRERILKVAADPTGRLQQLLDAEREQLHQLQTQQSAVDSTQQALQQQLQGVVDTAQLLQKQLSDLKASMKAKTATAATNSGASTSPDPAAAWLAALPDNPTLIPATGAGQNAYLRHLCASIANVKTLMPAEELLLDNFQKAGHPAPAVRPDLGLAAPVTSGDGSQTAPKKNTQKTPTQAPKTDTAKTDTSKTDNSQQKAPSKDATPQQQPSAPSSPPAPKAQGTI